MLRHAAIGSAAPRDQAYGQYPASQCAHAGRNFGIAASAVRGVVTPAPGTWLAPVPDIRRRQRSDGADRSEEHTSELQSLMRSSYAVFCLKKKRSTPQQELKHI